MLQKYIRVKTLLPNDVLPFVTREKIVHNFDGYNIKMDSARYQVFSRSLTCSCCGLVGTHFGIERFEKLDPMQKGKPESDLYHLNLYGVNELGEEVMLTKDHIKAKSKGGPNYQSNFQTMCIICNKEKGNK